MDELEALNMLLRNIGSSPVNSVDTQHPDAANAKTTLSRTREQLQRRSWWFNTEHNVVLEPNSLGEVKVPSSYTSIVFEDSALVHRGSKVYDRITQTYKLNRPVCALKIVVTLEWDLLPDVAQDYIAYKASAQFIRDELEDPQKSNELLQDAQRTWIDMQNTDLRESKYNMFNKPRVVRARAGVRPYNRQMIIHR